MAEAPPLTPGQGGALALRYNVLATGFSVHQVPLPKVLRESSLSQLNDATDMDCQMSEPLVVDSCESAYFSIGTKGRAERIVGILLSQGYVQSLVKLGLSEKDLQIDQLREVAHRAFDSSFTRWFWSPRVRIGVV